MLFLLSWTGRGGCPLTRIGLCLQMDTSSHPQPLHLLPTSYSASNTNTSQHPESGKGGRDLSHYLQFLLGTEARQTGKGTEQGWQELAGLTQLPTLNSQQLSISCRTTRCMEIRWGTIFALRQGPALQEALRRARQLWLCPKGQWKDAAEGGLKDTTHTPAKGRPQALIRPEIRIAGALWDPGQSTRHPALNSAAAWCTQRVVTLLRGVCLKVRSGL